MNEIWIVGAGFMAIEYARVLRAQGRSFRVIGRGAESAQRFLDATGTAPVTGGLDLFLGRDPELPEAAIVAVNVEALLPSAVALMKYGVKQLLIEKPGVCNYGEVDELERIAEQTGSRVYIGYNRRFFASVMAAEKIIKEDGGVSSFHFEFTEWARRVMSVPRTPASVENLFLTNSTHVVDTAFFLGGEPAQMTCFQSGAGELDWHPSGAVYAGAGVSRTGALFSYEADWLAPGRWAVEILTKSHRLYLKPMETLQIQQLESVKVEPVQIDDRLDREFKPGIYLQTKAFLENEGSRLCSLKEQCRYIREVYSQISGGKG